MSNRARSKRRRRPRKDPLAAEDLDPGSVPRPIRLLLESSDRFTEFLDPTKSLEDLTAEIETRVRTAVGRIVGLAAPYDVFDVLADVQLNELFHNPETYRETEHEGLAAAIEVVAICLASRWHREGSLPVEAGVRPRPDPVIGEIVAVARDLVSIGSMLGVIGAMQAPSWNLGSLARSAVLREIYVRNMAYPHMEEDTVRALMADPVIDAACRAVMGCGASDLQAVFDAEMDLHGEAWQDRFEAVAKWRNVLEGERQRFLALDEKGEPVPDEIEPEVKAEADELFVKAWGNPGDTAIHDMATVAAKAGVPPEMVVTVRDLASVDLAPGDPFDGVMEFLRGRNPFRLKPLLRASDGSTVAIHSGLLLSSIREITETQLKGSAGWEAYAKRRGQFLEDRAVDLLSAIFPMAIVHQGYEYFVPNPDAATPQTKPADYTKVVEGDALLVVDDVAIVVEAKAGSFTPGSRRGDLKRLTDDLQKIITSASKQADRTRDRILLDGGLRLRDGSWLDLSGIREVHTIAVSLDDLSGIATVTSRLVETGLLGSSRLPWTVSLHDLRVVSELIERPAEFNLYLRRRTEPDLTVLFVAQDELDLFLHYLAGRLYVEPDPVQVEGDLPQFGKARPSLARRRVRQRPTLIQSLTDPLDAWYAHQLGERSSPAPKPQLNCDPNVSALVDEIAARGEPGWLSTGTTFLDGSEALQRNFGRFGPEVVGATRADGREHSVTDMGGSRAAWSYVGVWASAVPTESRDKAMERLAGYITLKKHQMQAARGFALLFDPRGRLVGTAYDNRHPGPDPDLDDLVARTGLKPISAAVTAYRPRKNKPGRITPKKPKRR
jgi:hypothetical protein